jgi:AcrR family transcriptional regulator
VITLEQAVDAGCRYFLRHGTIDLNDLAAALAVSRATLYRVIGSRDALLAGVLWRLAERSLDRAQARRTREGIDGVLQVVRAFSRQLLASRPLRRFIATQPETATRVLTSPGGGLNHLTIAAAVRVFEDAGLTGKALVDAPGDGMLAPARMVEDPERVAYLLVRIVESLCFAEVAGTRADLDLTEQTIRAMLVRACTPRQSRITRFMDAAMCLVWTTAPDLMLAESRLSMVVAGV